MVPDKFNMVDMEGIDIITSQGEEIPGLYQKLVESIAQCRYQCVYNWKFDGILIPPTYVEMTIIDDVVWINEGVSVDEEDVIRIYSLEPPAPVPNILELSVTENGTYVVPEGYDGYNPVSVAVPSQVPVLDTLSVIANGTYTPPSGVDGYDEVIVNVPSTGEYMEVWDFKRSEPLTGTQFNLQLANNGYTQTSDGIYFNTASWYIKIPINKEMTLELDVVSSNRQGTNHGRFIMGNSDTGLIYRSTGKWSFYGNSRWEDTNETDPTFFDNSTVRVSIDSSGHWHIYKNGVLWWEPNAVANLADPQIGSGAGNSFYNITLSGLRIY